MHAERSREVTRLRNVAAELEDDIAALQRERANLIGQPQALADVTSHFVAAAGYPTAGAPGQYIVLEGKAKALQIGRASCRERVCQYVSISVVAVSLIKKNNNKYKNKK